MGCYTVAKKVLLAIQELCIDLCLWKRQKKCKFFEKKLFYEVIFCKGLTPF